MKNKKNQPAKLVGQVGGMKEQYDLKRIPEMGTQEVLQYTIQSTHDLINKFENEKKDRALLAEELEEFKKDYERLNDSYNMERDAMRKLNTNYDNLHKANEEKNANLAKLKLKNDNLQAENDSIKRILEEREMSLADIEIKYVKMIEELNSVTFSYLQSKDEINKLLLKHSLTESEMNELKEKNTELQTENGAIKRILEEKEMSLAATDDIVKEAMIRLEEVCKLLLKFSATEAENNELRTKNKKYNHELEMLSKNYISIEKEMHGKSEVIAELNAQKQKDDITIKKMFHKMKDILTENERLRSTETAIQIEAEEQKFQRKFEANTRTLEKLVKDVDKKDPVLEHKETKLNDNDKQGQNIIDITIYYYLRLRKKIRSFYKNV